MQSLGMTSVSSSDTFAIKGTQETITITISRQDEDDSSLKTQTPSRRNSNTSNSSSRSSTFNIHYIPHLGEDDISSSGFSDPGCISDNDLSPAASFHGSHEDIFTKGLMPSDTEEEQDCGIVKDISNSQRKLCHRNKKSVNNDGACSPRTRSKVCICVLVCVFI